MGAIIEDDQVILVTRDTENRGGPTVKVYKVKGSDNPRRTRKRQPNMPTELTGMIQGIIYASVEESGRVGTNRVDHELN
jgi:hypothetical protein